MYGLEIARAGTMPMFYAPTDRKVGHIATADVGALVVELLTTEWSGRRLIELGRPVSPDEIAEAIGKVLGREVKAYVIPRDARAETMEQFGLPVMAISPARASSDSSRGCHQTRADTRPVRSSALGQEV
jgi:uncharacterized protein YbjT (DUF2867 family)